MVRPNFIVALSWALTVCLAAPAQQIRDNTVRTHCQLLNSQPVKIIRPDYPPLARQTKTEGRVSLKCVIGINGSVEQIEVKKGHPLLIQASVEAVSKWKFKPPSFNGKAVKTDAIIDIDFQLVAEQKNGDSSQP
jgi:TonB family protein